MQLHTEGKHEFSACTTARILLLPTAFLIVYIVLRAAWLSFTLDESTSWLLYASPKGLFPENPDLNLANHHLLNSWLMKFCAALFGPSEFVLRLPNVLAGCVYCGVAILFAKKLPFRNGLLLFAALTFHPYLLQYFSMARGYGLAAAALLTGLYFAWCFWEEGKKTKHLLAATVTLFLAVLSNLATVDFVLPFLGVQFVLLMVPAAHRNYRQATVTLTGVVAVCVLAWLHGNYLEANKALHWGGTNGIWEDSVSSLCSSLLYDAPYSLNARALVKLFLRISCGLILIAGVVTLSRRKQSPGFFPALVLSLLLSLVFMLVLHYWRGTLFPLGRTGLFLLPVFVLALLLALQHANKRFRAVADLYASFFVVVLLVHFVLNMNFRQTLEWYYEADSRTVAQDLHTLDPEGKQTLYCDWLLNGTMDYYRTRFTFSRAGQGSNGVPGLSNDWALIDVWRHGYPDPAVWEVYRRYANNLVLFRRK